MATQQVILLRATLNTVEMAHQPSPTKAWRGGASVHRGDATRRPLRPSLLENSVYIQRHKVRDTREEITAGDIGRLWRYLSGKLERRSVQGYSDI
jgi:hypothetical protein